MRYNRRAESGCADGGGLALPAGVLAVGVLAVVIRAIVSSQL
jgi:hypothetical protein